MNKLLILVAVAILFLVGCKQTGKSFEANSNNSFTITGNITGLDNGSVYFVHPKDDERVTDSVQVNKNTFTFI